VRVQSNSIEATVNSILREWRDLWPGGLDERQYSTLNLLAHCREGSLGFNRARCGKCGHNEWYASSCGDRHCPNCLGPRQAQWAEQVCGRLPDCPHFHIVFTLPKQLHDLFSMNYRKLADVVNDSAAMTLKQFQRNNWTLEGGFFSVLHTWGSALNWHPHLHVLVSAGGIDPTTGRWKTARRDYSFPVKSVSKVFRSIVLSQIEALDHDGEMKWPEGWQSIEQRRQRRVELTAYHFNVFSKATLHFVVYPPSRAKGIPPDPLFRVTCGRTEAAERASRRGSRSDQRAGHPDGATGLSLLPGTRLAIPIILRATVASRT
jgi:hypothetical protein